MKHPPPVIPRHEFRYRQLAGEIEGRIHSGAYRPGEKLPSIRALHRKMNLSISTVHQAYMVLEAGGLIEARPKSGFYVSPVSLRKATAPDFTPVPPAPRRVELNAMVNSVLESIVNPDMLPLASSATSSDLLPVKALSRIMKGFTVKDLNTALSYSLPEGIHELRRQIAIRTLGVLKGIKPEDILITTGCMEAVSLCLRMLVKPGDTVAIESPTHFGFLQYFKEMGVMVAEIPTHPEKGVDLSELEKTIKRLPIRACLFMPSFQNPLGTLMSDGKKADLVGLLNNHEIPLIEDDICGEMFYEGSQRPSLARAFDRKDLVMTCSSFSKTLAPGLRVGWMIPGKRFKERILRLKAGTTVCNSTLDQLILARYLAEPACQRHFRRLREALKQQTYRIAHAILRYFPEPTRLALPKGGSLLWVQLPPGTDGLELYRKALDLHIAVLPGLVCSVSGQHRNFLRIGCGHPFTPEIEKGIVRLGEIADQVMGQ